jgi:hypothetical protein
MNFFTIYIETKDGHVLGFDVSGEVELNFGRDCIIGKANTLRVNTLSNETINHIDELVKPFRPLDDL